MHKKNDLIGTDASRILRDNRFSEQNKSRAGKALAALRQHKR